MADVAVVMNGDVLRIVAEFLAADQLFQFRAVNAKCLRAVVELTTFAVPSSEPRDTLDVQALTETMKSNKPACPWLDRGSDEACAALLTPAFIERWLVCNYDLSIVKHLSLMWFDAEAAAIILRRRRQPASFETAQASLKAVYCANFTEVHAACLRALGSRLAEFSVTHSPDTEDGAFAPIGDLVVSHGVESLRLRHTSCAFEASAAAWPDAPFASLQTLDLCSASALTDGALAEVLRRTPHVTRLALADCPKLTAKSMRAIASSVPNLRSLDLARFDHELPVDSIRDLAPLAPTLTALDLSSARWLGSDSILVIGQFVHLEALCLRWLPGMNAALDISRLLDSIGGSLTSLDLARNSLPAALWPDIRDKAPALRNLNVASSATQDGLSLLRLAGPLGPPRLEILDIRSVKAANHVAPLGLFLQQMAELEHFPRPTAEATTKPRFVTIVATDPGNGHQFAFPLAGPGFRVNRLLA
jgi:hypothetical protein